MNLRELSILQEIYRWKVVDMESLHHFLEFPGKEKKLWQILYRLEKRSYLKTTPTFWNNRKVYYLDSLGLEILGMKNVNYHINLETITHDALVPMAVKSLLKLNSLNSYKTEYELVGDISIVPDAVLYGEKKGSTYSVALEIELTQKSKSRFSEKLNGYIRAKAFHYVLYLFPSHKMRRNWEIYCKEQIANEYIKNVMWFSFEGVDRMNFADSFGSFQGKEVILKEIFS